MSVHVFGKETSQSVAIEILSKVADDGKLCYVEDVTNFVKRNFHVDGGFTSNTSPEEAINLLKDTNQMLSDSHINLLKVPLKSHTVMDAFNLKDTATVTTRYLPCKR